MARDQRDSKRVDLSPQDKDSFALSPKIRKAFIIQNIIVSMERFIGDAKLNPINVFKMLAGVRATDLDL